MFMFWPITVWIMGIPVSSVVCNSDCFLRNIVCLKFPTGNFLWVRGELLHLKIAQVLK